MKYVPKNIPNQNIDQNFIHSAKELAGEGGKKYAYKEFFINILENVEVSK